MKCVPKMCSGSGDLAIIERVSGATSRGSSITDFSGNTGRHALVITPEVDGNAKYLTPPPTNNAKEVLKGIWKMFSTCPYWDVSYLVATIFSLGSAVWVINAFFVWLPLVDPSTAFNNESTLGGGITAMIGATIFEVGSVLLMIEAVNENRSECFGWALEEALEEKGLIRVRPMRECGHHHKNKGNFVGKGKVSEGTFESCSYARPWIQ
jgi:hypothetical protein